MTTSHCSTFSSLLAPARQLDRLLQPQRLRPPQRLRRRASVATLLLVALGSSTTFAQEASTTAAPLDTTPEAPSTDAPTSPPPPESGVVTTTAAPTAATVAAPVAPASTAPTTSTEPSPALRRALATSACSEGVTRLTDGAIGLATAGALFGIGFAAEGDDMTWSHALWVSSGVVGVASVLGLIVPTDLESLARDSEGKTDAELRAEWKKIAEAALVERRTGAVVGSLIGTAAVIGGAVVLDGEGDFSQDNRTIFGTSLVATGALSIANGLVHWFVPSTVERDYSLVQASSDVQLSFSAAPTPGGAAVSVTGVF